MKMKNSMFVCRMICFSTKILKIKWNEMFKCNTNHRQVSVEYELVHRIELNLFLDSSIHDGFHLVIANGHLCDFRTVHEFLPVDDVVQLVMSFSNYLELRIEAELLAFNSIWRMYKNLNKFF